MQSRLSDGGISLLKALEQVKAQVARIEQGVRLGHSAQALERALIALEEMSESAMGTLDSTRHDSLGSPASDCAPALRLIGRSRGEKAKKKTH